jgi:hypothetical protein
MREPGGAVARFPRGAEAWRALLREVLASRERVEVLEAWRVRRWALLLVLVAAARAREAPAKRAWLERAVAVVAAKAEIAWTSIKAR